MGLAPLVREVAEVSPMGFMPTPNKVFATYALFITEDHRYFRDTSYLMYPENQENIQFAAEASPRYSHAYRIGN